MLCKELRYFLRLTLLFLIQKQYVTVKMPLAVTNRAFAPSEPVQLEVIMHSVLPQEPVTDTCLELNESRPHRHNEFFEIQINVIFPSKSPV